MLDQLLPVAKAVASGFLALCAYLVGILGGDQTLVDVTLVQWLGAALFVGGSFGITYRVPNLPATGGKHRKEQ